MNRLTIDKASGEMTMTELAHNCMYVCDRWAWYRDFEQEMDLRDFIRAFSKAEGKELTEDNEELEEDLYNNLQYGIDDTSGRVALVYRLMWALADLRERLKSYEDTGLQPGEILSGLQLAEVACLQIRYQKRQELLERAAECIENCYGRETELSEAIRKELN